MMAIFVTVWIGLSVAVTVGPLWLPATYAHTIGRWSQSESDRVLASMVIDLMRESCWKRVGHRSFHHVDSGLTVEVGLNRVTVGGCVPERKFEGWLPITREGDKLKKRVRLAEEQAASAASLSALTGAFKRMNGKPN